MLCFFLNDMIYEKVYFEHDLLDEDCMVRLHFGYYGMGCSPLGLSPRLVGGLMAGVLTHGP